MRHLEQRLAGYRDNLVKRYPCLKEIQEELTAAYLLMEECYEQGGKLLIAGNGGSAADAEHIVGELMKRFKLRRPLPTAFIEKLQKTDAERGAFLAQKLENALPAIPLVTCEALITAYINDVGASGMFAQQLFALSRAGDVFLGISTSGNSENILHAAVVAKAMNLPIIALTGARKSKLSDFADVAVQVPEIETEKIQELHLPIYHCWCMMLEDHFFGPNSQAERMPSGNIIHDANIW